MVEAQSVNREGVERKADIIRRTLTGDAQPRFQKRLSKVRGEKSSVKHEPRADE